MVLARWQATIVDDAGNVQVGAQVTVRRETAGAPLAVIYSDRNGLLTTPNPITADADGFIGFHAVGGAYRIDAVLGAFSRTWRYVGIGLSSESDAPVVDIAYLFSTDVADSDPGSGTVKFNNAALASVTTIYFDLLDDVGTDVTNWLARFDDFGSSSDRGVVIIRAIDGSAELVATVTGSVTTASGYRKVAVTVLGSTGTFASGVRVTVTFLARGNDGTGNVAVTGLTLAKGNVPTFGKDDGTSLVDSGSKLVGRQTIWLPAASWRPRPAAAPAFTTIEYAATGHVIDVLAFDATTSEWAFANFKAPKGWDEGTIQFQYLWMHQEGGNGGGVVFKLGAGAMSHQSPFPQTAGADFIAEVTLAATGNGKADTLFFSADSAVITIGDNSPPIMEGDLIQLRMRREPTDGSDTLNIDAQLIGVAIYYNTSKNTDD